MFGILMRVEIKFSRHASRRLKLYRIAESQIKEILGRKELVVGHQEIVEKVEGFKYPLKIVVVAGNDIITVITSYPLKRGRKE